MEALNRREIREKSFRFWGQFALLIFSILFVVYFFVWSAVMENKKYAEQLQAYKKIENTQYLLSYKVDSLYWYIDRLAPGRKSDERFLLSYIRDKKQEVHDIAAADSLSTFSSYVKITDQLNTQLNVRDSIIKVEVQNEELKKELDDCQSKNIGMRKNIGGAGPK